MKHNITTIKMRASELWEEYPNIHFSWEIFQTNKIARSAARRQYPAGKHEFNLESTQVSFKEYTWLRVSISSFPRFFHLRNTPWRFCVFKLTTCWCHHDDLDKSLLLGLHCVAPKSGFRATTLGNLFACACLCHQAIWDKKNKPLSHASVRSKGALLDLCVARFV